MNKLSLSTSNFDYNFNGLTRSEIDSRISEIETNFIIDGDIDSCGMAFELRLLKFLRYELITSRSEVFGG